MVTDALWSDYDNDGWEDLIVTREWNSIVVLKNMKGKELIPQYIKGLEELHGFWYTIAEGDFDKDGDKDYVAGNLGNNHRFALSDQYPLKMYALDVDMNGTIDPVWTAFWNDTDGKMTEYPVNYLDELWSQSKMFEALLDKYTPFSYMGIRDILKPDILRNLQLELFVNTTSSYILWNGKGKLIIERLPDQVQVAPAGKMIVEDFNHDTWPDILTCGNDYTWNLSTGYFDANKGLILLNEGNKPENKKPSFKVLGPSQSGLLLNGMMGSLLYVRGDTSYVIAGMNRSEAVVYMCH
jgi:hypothetical protein